MSVLEERLATLSPEKQLLLRRRVQKKSDAAPAPAIAPRAGARDRFPLSFAQRRLWFLDQLEPGSTAYNIVEGLRLERADASQPRLDPALVERCFNEVVARHEILRTVFVVEDGEPLQSVLPSLHVPLAHVDVRALDPAAREAEAQRWADVEAATPFDLAAGPLLRVRVVTLSDRCDVVLISMHHIISDGWSAGVLINEMTALYQAAAFGQPSPLAPLPIQYGDYAAWQRAHLSGATLDAQLRFWREHLGDAEPLELPTLRPRHLAASGSGAAEHFALSPELSDALVALARAEGVTMFMLFLAAYYALLSRYTGQQSVLAGTAMAGRHHRETEGLIGFFVNTLVLRGDLTGDPTFRELLARVREASLAAHAHQDFPFEKLVEELRPERGAGAAPLVQAMFVVQNAKTARDSAESGYLSGQFHARRHTARFDISLGMEEKQTWCGSIEYATDLFDAAFVRAMVENFIELLGSVAADPAGKVATLRLLTEGQRAGIVGAWNDTARAVPDVTVDALFDEQVRLRPDAPAVSCEGTTLTYAELGQRADALAATLRAEGVGPEVVVALVMEKSIDVVVAELAVVKAGGAYLPIDPMYPAERIEFMLDDAQPLLVIGDGLTLRRTGAAAVPAAARKNGSTLAYIIYTSGSTGRPKGVLIEHRNLTNLTLAFRDVMRITPESRILQFASISFDASVEEIWTALTSGACICIARRDDLLPVDPLVATIARERVTSILLPPSALALIDPRDTPSLESVVSAGEACNAAVVARWRGHVRLVNGYGPTECTVITTTDDDTDGSTIGKPIANYSVYILDAKLQPVPAGVAGEICIGGAGVGRGYLRRPELTAERFVDSPFGDGKLYRSGDRARFRPDGRVEFLGRFDHQVKLRGFRIELGEIESLLLEDDAVSDAVVIVRDGRLLAYVLGGSADPAALRASLERRLPSYMVPSSIAVLEAWPMTPNGKVDRKALPEPERAADAATPLQGETEERLAAIWRELLAVREIGAEENFFEAGGHSLLATQLVSRIEQAFGTRIALRTIFEQPTIRQQATLLECGGHAAAVGPVHIPRSSAPLSFAQQRLWFLEQLGTAGAAYNINIALRLEGPLDAGALERAVREILERHEVLRSAIELSGGEPVQIVRPLVEWTLPRSAAGSEEEAAAIARAEASTPFDLANPPLLRAHLVRLGERDHLFLLTIHHIAADGWSLGVLTNELVALYRGEALAPLAIQYADYAAWQREHLSGDALEGEIAYWRGDLGGVDAVELPTDFARPATPSYRGGCAEARIERDLAARLRALAQAENCTLYMAMLAAYELLLARVSDAEQVLVGSPIAGRTVDAAEALIGFFVNTLVLRGDLRGEPTVRELLACVRENALGAFAHQDLPFEKLVEALRPERTLAQSPLFEAMFVLQNAAAGNGIDIPGLAVRGWGGDGDAPAKFALTLTASERDGGDVALLLEYQRDLFTAATAERLLAMYVRLVEAMVAEPAAPVHALPLMSDDERRLVVDEWNATDAALPREETATDLFLRQAQLRPAAPALSFDGTTLSYAELAQRADDAAGELRLRGAGPGAIVAVMLDRSIELVVAQLAILMAGAAYLPIDPAYPQERIDFMLDDAKPLLVWSARGLSSPSHLANVQERANLAYIIYTSGSTGRPKGVMVEHRGLVNLAIALAKVKRIDSTSRVLQFASTSFDASVEEVFTALASGACLCLARRDDLLPVQPLAATIARERITVATLPPSVLALLDPRDTPSLRTVISAGEACNAAVVAKWGARLVNAYGPTEATVCATADASTDGRSIGRPLDNVRVYIVDRRGRPVPIGVAGEIWIGGAGVARGYLGRPELTVERFIANPFGEGRVYKTGDRGRFRADGCIEFLGRADDQVKLRGFRIELGEIEALLRAEAGVVDAVAVARGGRLAAYVTGTPSTDLRAALQRQLPHFMVPAAVVVLDAFPLTLNGKVDRKALPAAELGGAGAVAPRNATERELAAIWCELLGRDSVGVTDDFFALGGHSLLAVTLVEHVRERLGRQLPLRALFEHATIERLAASLDGEDGNLVTLRDGDATPLVLVHPIGGDVFAYRELAARLDRPVLALRATAALNDASLEELAAHYVAELRARVDGPCVLGGWSFGGVVAMEMARQMGERAERVVLIDSWIASDALAAARNSGVRQFLGDVAASRGLALPDDVDSIDSAAEAAKRAGIAVDAAALARQFEIYAANCRRLAGYVPRPYDTRALLVATDARPRGWSALVRDLRTLEVGGDHYSLLTHDMDALLPVLQINREVPIAADIP